MARERFGPGEFIEVFVNAPLAECERRDTRGLYAKARHGLLRNFTGVDSPYEGSEAPELHLQTSTSTVTDCIARILDKLD
jgi:bifunctional enzyme CysN/CysC